MENLIGSVVSEILSYKHNTILLCIIGLKGFVIGQPYHYKKTDRRTDINTESLHY